MASNTELAQAILDQFLLGAKNGRIVWTYADMAKAIGREGQHRLLGGPLDGLRKYCEENGLPDIATIVVSKASLINGSLQPSSEAVEKYDGWPGLRREQARVFVYDWSAVFR